MQRKMIELQDKIKQQQHDINRQEQDIRDKEDKISHCHQVISKMQQEQAICTLSARYSSKTIVVSWALQENQPATSSDWVGFFAIDSKNTQYIEYIKTGGTKQGSHHFSAPKTPGLYEFRLFLNGSYDDVVRSGVINIGPQLELSSYLEGDKIWCLWSLKGGELSKNDWIGFYESSNPTSQYISVHYIDPNAEQKQIAVDAPRKPGNYEFRFVPHLCNYSAVAKSDTVVIPNRDKLFMEVIKQGSDVKLRITWDIRSVDVSRSDWIAIYKKGEQNNNYLYYQYTDKIKNEVIFASPELPGEYECRYHSRRQSKYLDVARSPVVTIKDNNKVYAETEGPWIKVTWAIKAPKVTTSDWIAFYKDGASAVNYITYQYVDVKKNYLLFHKPADQSGKYFVRYFAYSLPKYQPLCESNLVEL